MKPLLVGESNPYQADPRLAQRFALYPDPPRCAGWNLCHRIMQLDEGEYLRRFDRVNLCDGAWSMKEARQNAKSFLNLRYGALVHEEVLDDNPTALTLVLFGSRVCAAFDIAFTPFDWFRRLDYCFVILPHPSGLSRAWNEPGAFERARNILKEAGVL